MERDAERDDAGSVTVIDKVEWSVVIDSDEFGNNELLDSVEVNDKMPDEYT